MTLSTPYRRPRSLLVCGLWFATACASPPAADTPPQRFTAFEPDAERRIPSQARQVPCMDVTVADLNGDDAPDLVLSLEGPRNLWLRNDGSGTFDVPVDQPTVSSGDSEEAAVFPSAGGAGLTVAFANEELDHLDELYVYDPATGWRDTRDTLPGNTPETARPSNSVVARDLDGDGAIDLLWGHRGQNRWLRSTADGWEDASDRLPKDPSETQDLAIGDLDGDGDLDVVLGQVEADQIWWQEDGRFVAEPLAVPQGMTRDITLLDVDGDGALDVVVGRVSWDGKNPQSLLLRNDGQGALAVDPDALPFDADDTLAIEPADLDHDGDPDLLVATTRVAGGSLQPGPWRAWRNDGGHYVEATDIWLPSEPMGEGLDVAAADLDNDGWHDLVLCNRNGPTRLLWGQAEPAP